MKLSKKVGFLSLYTIITVSIVISYIYIYNKLNKSSIDIINNKIIFIIILYLIIVSNTLIYYFINANITKRLKDIEKIIKKADYKNINDSQHKEIDVIYDLHNETSNVMDKLVYTKKYSKEEERNYSNILNAMSNAFFYLKAIENENGEFIDGIIVDLNYAAIELLGISKDKIINHSLSELYNKFSVYKDDFLKILKRINKTKSECIARELKITEEKWGVVSIYSISEDSFSIIINDVTEIKKHSEKMEYLAKYDTLTNLLNRHNLL